MAVPMLTDTMKKVDRAVARLEEIQYTIRSTNVRDNSSYGRSGGAQEIEQRRRRRNTVGTGGDERWRVLPEVAELAMEGAGKENACVQRRNKQNMETSPEIGQQSGRQRQALASRQTNSGDSSAGQSSSAAKQRPGRPIVPPVSGRQVARGGGSGASRRPMTAARQSSGGVLPTKTPPTTKTPPRPRTFCVEVRPNANPNRPWRLSSSSSGTTSTANTLTTTSSSAARPKLRPKSPPISTKNNTHQLKPFNSHQLKPLNSTAYKQPTTSPATIRPYLSPSKIAAKSSSRPTNSNVRSPNHKRHHKKNWLSHPSKAIRRISLLGKSDSPAKSLPSLINHLPNRRKPRPPIEALFQSSQSSPSSSSHLARKSMPNPATTHSPLPLPPALRVEGFRATAHVRNNAQSKSNTEQNTSPKRSSSCPRQHLGPLDTNTSLPQEHQDFQGGSLGKENLSTYHILLSFGSAEKTRSRSRKFTGLDCGAFHGCKSGCGSSVWPAMRRSWSFSHERSFDSGSSLAGAGPCLLKTMKGWMHIHKARNTALYKVDSFKQTRPDEDKLYFG